MPKGRVGKTVLLWVREVETCGNTSSHVLGIVADYPGQRPALERMCLQNALDRADSARKEGRFCVPVESKAEHEYRVSVSHDRQTHTWIVRKLPLSVLTLPGTRVG